MQLRYSEGSIEDLEEIKKYLQEKAGAEIALKVIREIRRVIKDIIAPNPNIGSQVKFDIEKELRFFTIGKYPNYIIYYSVENDLVVIRVLHGKRNIKSLLRTQD